MNPVVSFRQIGGRYVQLSIIYSWFHLLMYVEFATFSRPAFLCRVPRAKRYLIFGWVSHYWYRLFRAHGTRVASLRRWGRHEGCSSCEVSITLKLKVEAGSAHTRSKARFWSRSLQRPKNFAAFPVRRKSSDRTSGTVTLSQHKKNLQPKSTHRDSSNYFWFCTFPIKIINK